MGIFNTLLRLLLSTRSRQWLEAPKPCDTLALPSSEHKASQSSHLSPSIVRFEIHLTEQFANPIGTGPRASIFINDTFIGPTLHAHQGDKIEFLVRNYMQQDTAIHFHGIGQRTTPWSDGVPGLTQSLIHPGASFMYQWTAEDAGTYFYHGHAKAQMMDGLYGAIVIEPSADAARPFTLISPDFEDQEAMLKAETVMHAMFVSDWGQYTSSEFQAIESDANIDFACMDAIMFNGVGSQYCLDEATRDSLTNPIVLALLKELADGHMTAKGCIPLLQMFMGDFDLRLENVPPLAYRECVGGENAQGNYTVNVSSSSGWTALTFINSGGLYPLQLSIDNHEMVVYAVDGHYVIPETTDRVRVNTGSRISVMVKLDQEPARYSIRAGNDYLNQILGGYAELVYDGSPKRPSTTKASTDHAGRPFSGDVRSFASEDSKPFPPLRPARHAETTFKFVLKKMGRPYGAFEWTQTGREALNISHEAAETPTLFSKPEAAPDSELFIKTKAGEWVDLVLVTAGPFAQAHPMHKHGNRVFLLGSGTGDFPWDTVDEALLHLSPGALNFEDPPYLDTFNTIEMEGEANNTWTLVRYQAKYPGAWLFHCHVQTHLSGGMGMVILDGVDEFPDVPVEYREWNGFDVPTLEE